MKCHHQTVENKKKPKISFSLPFSNECFASQSLLFGLKKDLTLYFNAIQF